MQSVSRHFRHLVSIALLALLHGESAALAQQTPPYLLTTEERAELRQVVGDSLHRAVERSPELDNALGRVFRFMATPYDETIDYPRGLGQIQTRLDHLFFDDTRDGPSQWTTSLLFLEQNRFVGAGVHRCDPSSCENWGAFVADLETGHMISAVVDRVIEGKYARQAPLMVFSVDCANTELRKAARPFLSRLARGMLRQSIQWAPTAPAGAPLAPLKAKDIVVSCKGGTLMTPISGKSTGRGK